jgi:putative thiamine transport system substrate-binding protein
MSRECVTASRGALLDGASGARASQHLEVTPMLSRRSALRLALLAGAGGFVTAASARDWAAVTGDAKGQTVYFNAWGGDPKINAYLEWAAGETLRRHGVTVQHVKLADTADAVSRIIAEAGQGKSDAGGSVDLIWINGQNFATLKGKGLLHGPFAAVLPHFAGVDIAGNPTAVQDFTTPVEGYEAPWGTARFVLIHDSALDPTPPRTLAALLDFARERPGRFTYPQPPDFVGLTFLKQTLAMTVADRTLLASKATPALFETHAAKAMEYLEALRPHLWREGRAFPANATALRSMMANAELRLIMTFNPAMAANAVLSGELPASVRTFAFEGGSIGNTHFVAIPKNSSAKAGAMVFADFLLSPEAQAKKADLAVWGDPTVLAVAALPAEAQALFVANAHPALAEPSALGPMILEPHPSWGALLETAWKTRYAGG